MRTASHCAAASCDAAAADGAPVGALFSDPHAASGLDGGPLPTSRAEWALELASRTLRARKRSNRARTSAAGVIWDSGRACGGVEN